MKNTKKRFFEAIMLFQISLLTILQVWNGYIIIPNYSLIAKDLGVSNFFLGSMSGLYILVAGLSSLMWSYVSDALKIRRKWVLAPTLFMAGMLTLIVASTTDKVVFFVCRVLTGVFLGALNPLIYSIIADKFESHKRARAYMVWYLVSGIGLAVGFVSSVLLAMFYGWRAPISLNGEILMFFAAPLAFLLLEPKRASADLKMINADGIEYVYKLHIKDLALLANNKTVVIVSVEEFVSTVPQGVLLAWLTLYVVEELRAPEIVAIVYLGLGMLGGLLGFLVVHVADKAFKVDPQNRTKIASISLIIQTLMILAFFLLPVKLNINTSDPIQAVMQFLSLLNENILIPLTIIFFFVGMIFNSAIEPIKNAVISDVNLPEHRAIVISAISTVELFFRSAGIALAGLLIDVFGNVRFVLMGFVMLYLLSAYLWYDAKKYYRRDIERVVEILSMRIHK